MVCDVLLEAASSGQQFSVMVVDSKPLLEGKKMLDILVSNQITCTYIFLSAVSSLIQDVQIVMLGSTGILSNGCVMSRIGTAQIALVAKSFDIPVLVCCETYKFSSNVQSNAFQSNELCKYF